MKRIPGTWSAPRVWRLGVAVGDPDIFLPRFNEVHTYQVCGVSSCITHHFRPRLLSNPARSRVSGADWSSSSSSTPRSDIHTTSARSRDASRGCHYRRCGEVVSWKLRTLFGNPPGSRVGVLANPNRVHRRHDYLVVQLGTGTCTGYCH